MTPTAYVVHRVGGRVRLRIREKREDFDYFDAVRERLGALSDLAEVQVNEGTGSIILTHPQVSYGELRAALTRVDLFEVAEGPEPGQHALAPLLSGIGRVDQAISRATSGNTDLRALLFLCVLATAVYQALRGNILSPAWTLVWNGLDLVTRIDDIESNGAGNP